MITVCKVGIRLDSDFITHRWNQGNTSGCKEFLSTIGKSAVLKEEEPAEGRGRVPKYTYIMPILGWLSLSGIYILGSLGDTRFTIFVCLFEAMRILQIIVD